MMGCTLAGLLFPPMDKSPEASGRVFCFKVNVKN